MSKFFTALHYVCLLCDYFDILTKLFSDLYLSKFLDTSIKSFSMYSDYIEKQF